MVMHVGQYRVSRGQPRPNPKGRGPSVLKLCGTLTYAKTVLSRAAKFGMVPYVGQ